MVKIAFFEEARECLFAFLVKLIYYIIKKFEKTLYKRKKVWYNKLRDVHPVFGFEAVKQHFTHRMLSDAPNLSER